MKMLSIIVQCFLLSFSLIMNVESYYIQSNLKILCKSKDNIISKLKHSSLRVHDDDNADPSTISSSSSSKGENNRLNGQGEWEDWENESHIDEEYVMDDEDTMTAEELSSSNTLFKMMKESMIAQNGNLVMSLMNKIEDKVINKITDPNINQVVKVIDSIDDNTTKVNVNSDDTVVSDRDPDYWKGWSEEAPYFDEYDVQDDEGNWGRSDEEASNTEKGVFQSKSSDLWNRYIAIEDKIESTKPTAKDIEISYKNEKATVSSVAIATSTNDDKDKMIMSNSESLLLLIQMQDLERRIDHKLAHITNTLEQLKVAISPSLPLVVSTTTTSQLLDKSSEKQSVFPPVSTVIAYMLIFTCMQYTVNSIMSKL